MDLKQVEKASDIRHQIDHIQFQEPIYDCPAPGGEMEAGSDIPLIDRPE
jgi:hypothetical protein